MRRLRAMPDTGRIIFSDFFRWADSRAADTRRALPPMEYIDDESLRPSSVDLSLLDDE